jgi:hypothetical protein
VEKALWKPSPLIRSWPATMWDGCRVDLHVSRHQTKFAGCQVLSQDTRVCLTSALARGVPLPSYFVPRDTRKTSVAFQGLPSTGGMLTLASSGCRSNLLVQPGFKSRTKTLQSHG